MLRFDNKNISSNISRFHMFITETDHFDIGGMLCNFDYDFSIEFTGIRQMLERLELLFDYVNFPQATHQKRSFHDTYVRPDIRETDWLREIDPQITVGKDAQFLLHVQFRHHSTWQGTLELLAEHKIKPFRSELELMSLLATALQK